MNAHIYTSACVRVYERMFLSMSMHLSIRWQPGTVMARASSSLVAPLFVLTNTSGAIGDGGLRFMAALGFQYRVYR